MRRLALVPTLAAVLLFPTIAAALGLGEIEVHSALNQRLDAQIPLRGVPEGQADDIIVALASERAFRDVGLQRPHALTRLRFAIRQRDDGRYYVHATSSEPIAEPFLSFLLEVDGPGGNLLREYTVLLDPPVFATERAGREQETAEAETEAPAPGNGEETATADMGGEIERDATAAEPESAEPEPAERETAVQEQAGQPEAVAMAPADDTEERTEFGDTPVFLEVEREQARAERDRRAERAERDQREQPERSAERDDEPRDEAVAEAYQPGAGEARETGTGDAGTAPGERRVTVERGDTLWSIASRLRRGDMTVQQLMLALLRYNPEAFTGDNINRLRHGYVLRVPEEAEIRSVPARQAIARVREQNTLWREWRTAARGEGEAAVAERAAETDTAETDTAETDTAAAAEDDAESRLSIVGSSEGGASSDESASATTDGEAAAEELALAREQLESARMEKAELESRVDDLEETVDKMERLITLREDQLARLQEQLQRLQQDEAGGAAPVEEAPDGSAAGAGEPADDGAAAGGPDDDGGDPAGGAQDDGTETAAAEDGGGATGQQAGTAPAGGDTGAGTTRTAVPDGWLERITGVAAGITATVTGTLAGLAGSAAPFAPPASPGVLGAAALLLVALAGLLVVRRRRAAAEADADIEALEETALAEADASDEVDLGRMDAGSDLIAEELDSDESARPGRMQGQTSGPLDEAFDLGDLEADSGEGAAAATPPEEDEAPKDDTVAEAEVYLAYGLHQQAEDLLRLALRESPGRADYHEKLLETLYAAGKKGEFVTEAGTFHGMVESTDSRMWQRVVAMGREVAPEHELFRKSAAPDVRPEELQKTRPATADIELDPGGGDAAGEEEEDDFARSLMLDEGGDLETSADDAGLQGPGGQAGGTGEEDLDLDLGDFEQLAGDTGETATADTARTAEAGAGADDALDFDLADLGGGAGSSTDDEGGLDFDIGLDEATGTDEAPATAGAGEGENDTDTGGVPDLDLGGLEFEAEPHAGSGDGAGEYSLDVDDQAPGADSGLTLGGEDDDEFDTMLDLARAYIDMGDPESASNALEEVIESGSEKQRNEARSLLESVQ